MLVIPTIDCYYGIKLKWYHPKKEGNNYMYNNAICMIEKEIVETKKI